MKHVACLLIMLLSASAARATILIGTPQVEFYVEYGSDTPPYLDAASFSCFSLGAGANTTVTFEFGPTTAYGVSVRGYYSNLFTAVVSGEYSQFGLDVPHGVYHCRVKVTGAAGTAYSKDTVFRMPNNPPGFVGGFIGYLAPTKFVVQPGGHLFIDGDSFDCIEPEGDPVHVTSFTQPPASQGRLTKVGSGLLFTAAPGYTGGFQTQYKLADNYGAETWDEGTLDFTVGDAVVLDHSFQHVAAASPLPPGTQDVSVPLTSNGSYGVVSQASWITVVPHPPWQNVTAVDLRVAPNASALSRTGTVMIGSLSFVIEQAGVDGPPLIVPTPGDPGMAGVLYDSHSVAAAIKGGWPIRYSLSSGRLPAGLTLSPFGEIIGVPTVAGSYPFTVKIANALGFATFAQTIDISALPDGIAGTHVGFTPNSTPLGLLGGAFQFSVTTTGKVSGFITLNSTRYAFLSTNLLAGTNGPVLQAQIPRSGMSPWQLDLSFNHPSSGLDAGRVTDPSAANSTADICLPWAALVVPVDMTTLHADYYTALVSDSDIGNGVQDAGTLSVKVTASRDHKSGSAAMVWHMIDGQVISLSSPLTNMGGGSIAMPVNLPRGSGQRLLQGIIEVKPAIVAGENQTLLSAVFDRFRVPAVAGDPFTTDTDASVSGANWTAPASGTNALRVQPNIDILVFTSGALDDWPWTFTLSSRSVPTFGADLADPGIKDPAAVSITINAATGTWTGSYYVTATTPSLPARVKTLMQGVIMRPTATFAGWNAIGWTLQPQYEPGTNTLLAVNPTIVSFSTVPP